jgi:hypothetical protein
MIDSAHSGRSLSSFLSSVDEWVVVHNTSPNSLDLPPATPIFDSPGQVVLIGS